MLAEPASAINVHAVRVLWTVGRSMSDEPQGWHRDPFGRHEWRYFSAGRPTYLVRDSYTESSDPVEDILPLEHLQAATYVPTPLMPRPWSVPTDEVRATERISDAGRPGRRPIIALALVIAVVGMGIFAIAATRHHPPSSASASSVAGATASTSAVLAGNSPSIPAQGSAGVLASNSPAVAASVLVASAGGHFAARFPSTPVQASSQEAIAGIEATIRVAAVESPPTEVVEEDIAGGIPAGEQPAALRSAIAVAASIATDGSPTQQNDTTFRGKAARTSTFPAPSGEQVTAIAFFEDPHTVYFLLADAGAPIEALSASLQIDSTRGPSLTS